MPRKETKILAAVLLVSDLAILAIFGAFYAFTRAQIEDTARKEAEVKAIVVRDDTLSLMKNDISFGEGHEGELESFIVPADGVADLLGAVEGLAASSSVSLAISSISYETPSDLTPLGLDLVAVDLHLSGGYQNIRHFLELLEEYPLDIAIGSVSLAAGDGKSWTADIAFTAVGFAAEQ